MPANPFFSGRIPQQLHDAVEERCRQTGESKTQILVAALSQYLGVDTLSTKSNAQSLSTAADVNQKIAALENLLESKLDEMEKRLDELESESQRKKHPQKTDGQMSIDDIHPLPTSTDNKFDNKVIKSNDAPFIGTGEASKLTGVPRQTLDDWRKLGKSPQERNGFLITFSHMEGKLKRALWKVQKIDNTDNSDN